MDGTIQYKVAAVQGSQVFLDANATIDKTTTLMEEAAKKGGPKSLRFPKHGFQAIRGLSDLIQRPGEYNLFLNTLKISFETTVLK
tara:strand:- start:328 stop:582 length:255 start_codon:yes stop_codon:yes gene_type:complete